MLEVTVVQQQQQQSRHLRLPHHSAIAAINRVIPSRPVAPRETD